MILIPPVCRSEILEHLHSGHLGVNKMKSLSRLMCWWPGINSDINDFARSCGQCKLVKPDTHPQLIAWPLSYKPWQRVHVDYCGPFVGGLFALVIIDSYSKWPEVYFTKKQTTAFTISALRKTFSREGIPQVIVSDNGSPFTSHEMKEWLNSIGCYQVFTPPRHPQSNGQAESFVKTLKLAIEAMSPNSIDALEKATENLLLQYRNAVHSSTKHRPAELFKGRKLRNVGNLDTARVIFQKGNSLSPTNGIVLQQQGQRLLVLLDLEDGSIHRRHIDQVTLCSDPQEMGGVTCG